MTAPTTLKKRSVNIAGHSTSVTLEQAFWDDLKQIAARDTKSVSALIQEIDQARAGNAGAPNLSSAIRVFILQNMRNR